MGLLDSIENMVQQGTGGQQETAGAGVDAGTNGKVASGLLQALDEHPGGLGGILDHFKNNGMGDQVQGWASGAQPTATQDQMHQGLQGSGLIDRVAGKAGVSPQVAEMAMATVMPMLIAHFTQGGQAAPPQSGYAAMASQILGRLL